MRFLSTPFWASKFLPCHPKWLMSEAISWVYWVPGAMIAVPSASPLGISPAVLLVNSSSSWAWDICKSCGTS